MTVGRKTGGRHKGTPNKVTADIRSVAQSFGPAAIAELARIAGLTDEPGAKAEATRVIAIRELLDRGFGKAQPVEGDAPQDITVWHLMAARQVSAELQAERLAGQQGDRPPHMIEGNATRNGLDPGPSGWPDLSRPALE
jgi:hypothetical protein